MTHKKMLIYLPVAVAIVFLFILMVSGCARPMQSQYPTNWQPEGDGEGYVQMQIHVNSEPSGAKVFVNDAFSCNTPCPLRLWGMVGRRMYWRFTGVGQETEIRWTNFTGKCDCMNVMVYKEGYKRESKRFCTDNEQVRRNFPNDYGKRDSGGNLPPIYAEENWTAFLQKDAKPPMMQQQQQQQQIIIEKPKAVSYLSISSDPSDAEVYLDGNLIGTTPINNMKLNPGNYRLKVMKGSKTWERNIMVPEEGSLQIKAKPE